MRVFFSVIIPVYNRASLIGETIQSVLNQNFTDFELIIIDDASTDNTFNVINAFVDSRIRVIRNNKNEERGASRNKGIKASKGQYICFLDSDDLFEQNHLDNFYQHIQKRSCPLALFFSNSYLFDSNSTKTKKYVPSINHYNIYTYILKYTFNPARVCIHSDILKKHKFDPNIPGLEDLDLWLRVAGEFSLIQLKEYTNIYRLHEGSYTQGDLLRHEKELYNFKKIFSKPELKGHLPLMSRWRLLSMCYYHLSAKYEQKKERFALFKSVTLSFFLYPKGYNGKTNKVLLVRFIYHLPFLGLFLKKSVSLLKNAV